MGNSVEYFNIRCEIQFYFPVLTLGAAGVGGVGGGPAVRFPDVHLGAAGSVLADAGVDVGVGRLPVLHVGLAVDPLDVVRALGVAVAGAVGGARAVGRVVWGAIQS